MEHITDEVVGKRVVGPDGTEIGKVTAVEGNRAILKAETGLSASLEAAVSPNENGRISLSPNQIASVTADEVQLGDI